MDFIPSDPLPMIAAAAALTMLGVWALVALIGTRLVQDALSGPEGELPGWLRRLRDEPAVVRSAVTQALALLVIIGLELEPAAIVAIETAVAGLVGFWIRAAVTPGTKLEQQGFVYDAMAGRWRRPRS